MTPFAITIYALFAAGAAAMFAITVRDTRRKARDEATDYEADGDWPHVPRFACTQGCNCNPYPVEPRTLSESTIIPRHGSGGSR